MIINRPLVQSYSLTQQNYVYDLSQISDAPLICCLSDLSILCVLPPTPHFSFDVSLTCSRDSDKEEPPYDVALKLTVRFTDRQFLRCARISGKWVGEEASTAYFPFIPDQPFRVKMFLGVF